MAGPDPAADLPPPAAALDGPYGILVAGVGGTGVVTIGQLIAFAAHMDGRAVSVLDFTGLSQKGGGVLTHVRLAPEAGGLNAARLGVGGADLLLACDMVVAAGPAAVSTVHRGHTKAVVNDEVMPTAATVLNPDAPFDTGTMRRTITEAVGSDDAAFIDAAAATERLLGDKIFANVFLLGFAFQRGLVPVGLDAMLAAIEANGTAVEDNKRAFAWGRLAAVDRERVLEAAGLLAPPAPAENLDALVARRADYLTAYQDAAYARRYRDLVSAAAAAERSVAPASERLARAVAVNYFRLLAVKDEYEVARLHTDPAFLAGLRERFEGEFRLRFHLAPPFLAGATESGRPRKRAYGAWILPLLRGLAAMRRLRGSALDVFGYAAERRAERRLREDYERMVGELLSGLDAAGLDHATSLASLPAVVRGFGPVKEAAIAEMERKKQELMKNMGNAGKKALAAE